MNEQRSKERKLEGKTIDRQLTLPRKSEVKSSDAWDRYAYDYSFTDYSASDWLKDVRGFYCRTVSGCEVNNWDSFSASLRRERWWLECSENTSRWRMDAPTSVVTYLRGLCAGQRCQRVYADLTVRHLRSLASLMGSRLRGPVVRSYRGRRRPFLGGFPAIHAPTHIIHQTAAPRARPGRSRRNASDGLRSAASGWVDSQHGGWQVVYRHATGERGTAIRQLGTAQPRRDLSLAHLSGRAIPWYTVPAPPRPKESVFVSCPPRPFRRRDSICDSSLLCYVILRWHSAFRVVDISDDVRCSEQWAVRCGLFTRDLTTNDSVEYNRRIELRSRHLNTTTTTNIHDALFTAHRETAINDILSTFCRARLCKRGLCRHAMSAVRVCLYVYLSPSYILSKRIKITSKLFLI